MHSIFKNVIIDKNIFFLLIEIVNITSKTLYIQFTGIEYNNNGTIISQIFNIDNKPNIL